MRMQVTEDQLRAIFQRFGEIVYVKIPAGKGCGFVQFMGRPNAEAAMLAMNGQVRACTEQVLRVTQVSMYMLRSQSSSFAVRLMLRVEPRRSWRPTSKLTGGDHVKLLDVLCSCALKSEHLRTLLPCSHDPVADGGVHVHPHILGPFQR